jgi:hypothetical protein
LTIQRPPKWAFNIYEIASSSVVAFSLWISVSVSEQHFALSRLIVIEAMTLSSLSLGRVLLPHHFTTCRLYTELVLGFFLSSLMILGICCGWTVSAGCAFSFVVALAVLAAVFCCYREVDRVGCAADLVVLSCICSVSLIWSWQAIVSYSSLERAGLFTAWSDYFIHSAEIAQFADFDAMRGTSVFASGEPLPLYHYGSYMLPAALSSLTGIPAVVAATAFWTPLGFILLGMGVFVLGSVGVGKLGGIFAAAGILLLPSASHYGLENPFFDFHWLLQISSGGGYALAFSCLATSAMIMWRNTARVSLALLAIGIVLGTFEFRVHIFVPTALTLAAFFYVSWSPKRRRYRVVVLLFGIAGLVSGGILADQLKRAPHVQLSAGHLIGTLLLLNGMGPSPYADLYARIVTDTPTGAAILLGLLILILGAFGAWPPIYGAWLIWRRLKGSHGREDLIPLLSLCSYLAVGVTFAGSTLEPDEFAHRPFVLVYAMLVIWCARFGATALSPYMSWRWIPPTVGAVLGMLLLFPVILERTAQRSMLSWGDVWSRTLVPQGIRDAASFVRTHAAPGDIVAISVSPLDEVFLALSERPEFFPGTPFLLLQSGISPAVARARRDLIDLTIGHPITDLSRGLMKGAGIKWAVILPPSVTEGLPANADSAKSTCVVMQLSEVQQPHLYRFTW